jgi:hypothetical protein
LPAKDFQARGAYQFRSHGFSFSYLLFTVESVKQYDLTPQPFEIAKTAWVPTSQLSKLNAGADVLVALSSWS